MKKLIFSLAIAYHFLACNSQPNTAEVQPVPPGTAATTLEQMKAGALEETDYIGRVRDLFKVLQAEYDRGVSKVEGVGNMALTVDDDFSLNMTNKYEGHVYLTKVNLKDLEYKNGGMIVLPEKAPNTNPGVKINLTEGRPKVQHLKDGVLVKEEVFIEFYLADRAAVEKVVPAIYQAINLTKGLPTNQ